MMKPLEESRFFKYIAWTCIALASLGTLSLAYKLYSFANALASSVAGA